jgi:hypothetical protein
MPRFKKKQCATCGAMHFGKTSACWHCIRAKEIAENQKYCAVCERPITKPSYCITCHHAVSGARTRFVSGAIAREIKNGRMLPAKDHKCVDCGSQAKDYDHREYLKPLQVVPVCGRCNRLRGPTEDIKAFVAKHLDVSLDRLAETLKEMRARKDVEIAHRHNSSLALGQLLVDLHDDRCGAGAKRK